MTSPTPSAVGNIDELFAASPSDLSTAGGLWYAPYGTELPTDVDEPLHGNFKNLGFVSNKGVQVKIDGKTNPIEVWGGDEIGSLRDKFAVEYSMALFQVLSPHVNAAIFGANAVQTAPATAEHGKRMKVIISSKLPKRMSLVLDAVYEDKLIRQVASMSQLSDLGDITLVHNEPMALEPTFRVLKGTDGAHVLQYSDDGVVVVGGVDPTVFTATISGSPTGGNITFSVGGQTTASIAHNAAAGAVEDAIEVLSTVGAGNVTVTGSAGGPWTITLAQGGTLTGSGAGLTGGSSPALAVVAV